MQAEGPAISRARLAAAMGVSLAVSPLWLAVNPVFWLSWGSKDLVPAVISTGAGAMLVGAVFVVATWTREKAPSSLFALVVPLIGVLGFAVAYSATTPFVSFVPDVESNLYLGLIWAYLFGIWATLPVAVAHTLLMIWVVKPRAPEEVTAPPLPAPPVGDTNA